MGELDAIRREVCELHAELPRNGLVVWTGGNLSARVLGDGELLLESGDQVLGLLQPGREEELREALLGR